MSIILCERHEFRTEERPRRRLWWSRPPMQSDRGRSTVEPTASGPAPPKNATVQMLRRRDMRRRWCGSFHKKLLRAFAVPTPRIVMETMNMRCNWDQDRDLGRSFCCHRSRPRRYSPCIADRPHQRCGFPIRHCGPQPRHAAVGVVTYFLRKARVTGAVLYVSASLSSCSVSVIVGPIAKETGPGFLRGAGEQPGPLGVS
jgi:hypothetical protein